MAEPLFENLRSLGAQLIEEMIEGGHQETLTLDFKANVENPGNPLFGNEGKKLTKTGRKTLAKAASAFANSMGGILILGVNCRSIEGVDCAQEITPIPNLSKALSTINNELHSVTIPSIGGIEAIPIPINDGSSGLIAVSIPRSDRRPHRSSAVDARSYFKRSGTSTVEMEHYEIEQAFMSNSAPELFLSLLVSTASSGGPGALQGERLYRFVAKIIAENIGGGIAKHIFLQCRHTQGVLRHFGGAYDPSKNGVGVVEGALQVALPGETVIHPGTKRIIESFPIEAFIHRDTNKIRIGKFSYDSNSTMSFKFNFAVSAEGMRQNHQTVEVALSELVPSENSSPY